MTESKIVAFVCLHGSAKSLIAAEYLNGLATARGFEWRATTSGPEPDAAIPANVVEGLHRHGIDVSAKIPKRVSAPALAGADHIVSFACDLEDLVEPDRKIERWDDCPAVSDDFEIAWTSITGRVAWLLERLRAEG